MFKSFFFTSVLSLFVIATSAQNSELEFGKLSKEDLLQAYSKIDSTADAEVLYDYADIDFEVHSIFGLAIRMKVHKRVKIYANSGLDHGNFNITLYEESSSNREVINGIKGITYNLVNGQMTTNELNKKSIFNERVQDKLVQYKISMPNVTEGSVVEYEYEMVTPLSILNKPRTWSFQSSIPMQWSELDITIPAHFYYQMIMGGYLPLHRNFQEKVNVSMGHTKYDTYGIHYNLVVKDAPAFKDESFITTEKDYISKIDFELSSVQLPGEMEHNYNTTWEELDRTILASSNWGLKFKANRDVKDLADQFKDIKDPLEKMNKIHHYIATEFKWDGYASLWAGDNMKKLFDNKIGNSTELNILLCMVLREAGLEANPVILSTRNNGKINLIYPLLDRFNYTIVASQVGDELVFMDATDHFGKPGVIPPRCIVDDVRVILPSGGYFTKLNTSDTYAEMVVLKATIDPEKGAMKGDYLQSSAGLLAHKYRLLYEKSGEDEFKKELIKSMDDWELDNLKLENFDNLEASTVLSYDFNKEDAGVMPDMIYVASILANPILENPLKRKTREFPVDFGHVINQTYKGLYTIPEGFEVVSLPQSVSIAIPEGNARFLFSVAESNGSIMVMSRIVFKKRTYEAAEYPYLRELYAKIVEKHSEQIVLRKN